MRYILLLIMLAGLQSCGGPQYQSDPNTELTVHYDGKLVHERRAVPQSDYISREKMNSLVTQNKDFIIIFAADWCSACKLTKKALKQANLSKPIYYLNVEEPWVSRLIAIMKVDSIPFMVHTNKEGQLTKALIGPKDIVLYLLLNYSKPN